MENLNYFLANICLSYSSYLLFSSLVAHSAAPAATSAVVNSFIPFYWLRNIDSLNKLRWQFRYQMAFEWLSLNFISIRIFHKTMLRIASFSSNTLCKIIHPPQSPNSGNGHATKKETETNREKEGNGFEAPINTLKMIVNHFYVVNPACFSISNIFLPLVRQQKNLFEYFRNLCAFYQIIWFFYMAQSVCVCLKNKQPAEKQTLTLSHTQNG